MPDLQGNIHGDVFPMKTETVKKSIPEYRGMANIKIQQLPGGQLIVSIPGALAVALDLRKGQEITWKLDGSRLYLERANNRDGNLNKNKL